MDAMFMIYVYTVIGNLGWIIGLSGVIGGGSIVYYAVESTNDDHRRQDVIALKLAKLFGTIFMITAITASFYPTKDDLKFILGGAAAWKAGEYILNNENAQEIPDNLLRAINDYIKQEETTDE